MWHATSGYRAGWNPATRDNAEKRSGYWHQMQAFAQAVQRGQAVAPTLRDAWRNMVVCEAICDSIEQGRSIACPPEV